MTVEATTVPQEQQYSIAELLRAHDSLGEKASNLYKPENISALKGEAVNITAARTASLMSQDFALRVPEAKLPDVINALDTVAMKQAQLVKPRYTESNELAGWDLADMSKVSDSDVDAALNQHVGYMSLVLSEAAGLPYETVRKMLGSGEILVGNIDAVAAAISQMENGSKVAEVLKAKFDYGVVANKRDGLHLLANLPGAYAGEQTVDYVQKNIGMNAEQLFELICKPQDDLMKIINSTEKADQRNRQAILFAIYAAKTSWQVSAVEKGLVQNKPSRYDSTVSKPGEVDTGELMTLPHEMVKRITQDVSAERANLELLKDIVQIRSYLERKLNKA